jgi:hypothetical protein
MSGAEVGETSVRLMTVFMKERGLVRLTFKGKGLSEVEI